MPDHDEMVRTVEAYVAGFNAGDVDAITSLFADDASVEDPVGSPAHNGADAIRAFYNQTVGMVSRMELDGAVRTVKGTAAFAMNVYLKGQTPPVRVEVIELFHLNEAGKIAAMRAYFNERNFTPVAG